MKIGEVIARVQHEYSKGVPSDDSRLSNRLIYNKLKTVRSEFLINDSRKNRTIDDSIRQSLIIELEADGGDCKASVCRIMRSKSEIPDMVLDSDTDNFVVTSTNGEILFTSTKFEDVKHQSGNKYTSNYEKYYFEGDIIKIVNSRIGKIAIRGIWEDPIVVEKMNISCNNGSYVNNQDIDFYTPSNMIDGIVKTTATELLGIFTKMKEDTNNNTAEN